MCVFCVRDIYIYIHIYTHTHIYVRVYEWYEAGACSRSPERISASTRTWMVGFVPEPLVKPV